MKQQINLKEFQEDYNNNLLNNEELKKKYGFNSTKELNQYAKDNIKIVNKELTTEEQENLKGLSKFLEKVNKII